MNFNSDTLYFVFVKVLRLHYLRSHTLLDKIGIYPGQPPMLYTLYKKDGQSQTDLANILNIKPATITVMLNRMEKEKLVQRRSDPDDQRISRVYLTEKGHEISLKVDKVLNQLAAECFANFTEEEKIILRRLLIQITDNLKSISELD